MSAFRALDERGKKKDMKKVREAWEFIQKQRYVLKIRHYKGEEHRLNSLRKKPEGSLQRLKPDPLKTTCVGLKAPTS